MNTENPPTSLFTPHHERFFFLYGKTDDEFCLFPEGILRLEEALHRHLSALSYRRILFFNGKQKLHFYDHESRHLCLRSGNAPKTNEGFNPPQQTVRSRLKTMMCNGPLGMWNVRQSPERTEPQNRISHSGNREDENTPLNFGRTGDLEMVSIMDHCMRDATVKSALIFTDGLDFINHTDRAAVRQMAANLNQWGSLFSTNENICVFLLPDLDAAGIGQLLQRTVHWQFLATKMFSRNNRPSERMIYVGPPGKDEVENLVHYHRLKKNLKTDWPALSVTVLSLARLIRSNGERLKDLSVRLTSAKALDRDTLARFAQSSGQTPAMDRLRSMNGLETVAGKIDRFIYLQKESETDNAKSLLLRDEPKSFVDRLSPPPKRLGQARNLHLVLTGNPGTGKTTVAHLLGEIFRDAGLLELGHVVKASREDLVAGYVGQTALKTTEKITEAMGGILFIDEAYRLAEGGRNDFGMEAVETVMEAMHNRMGDFSVVIAGYPERIESFLDANPGLRRRFGPQNMIRIPDYEPSVLHDIFGQCAKQAGRRVEGELRKRLPDFFANWHAARDPETFGNAGDAVNLFQETDASRAERVRNAGSDAARDTITLEDIPKRLNSFLQPRKTVTVEDALGLLDDLTGLAEVKTWLRKLTRLIQVQQEQRRRGMTVASPAPGHYVFAGRPGTGKTTVARLLGTVMRLLGLLGRDDALEIGPSDLIDKYVGGTEEKAKKLFKKAINGVLFVDEAHRLAEGGDHAPGQAAVRELVPFMLNNKDTVCVVAAGYPAGMTQFLDLDPGLRSRFTRIVRFEDFDENELSDIFLRYLEKNGEIPGPGLREEVFRLFQVWVIDKNDNFGNARDVHKLVDRMRECRAERISISDISTCSDEEMCTFLPDDIPEDEYRRIGKKTERLEDVMASLDDLVGLARVKNMVRSMINRLKVEKLRGGGDIAPGHYIFIGNPGTGKTTVARKMGEMFRALGLLKKGHLVETGRPDLVAGYQGQTALKTRKVLEQSLDGVLFIDEAYQLVEDDRDSFGKEALETLVAFMENHRDRLCIIAAGYPAPMRAFVNRNPGLPSRFSAEITFDNYSAGELLGILKTMATDRKMTLGHGVETALLDMFGRMAKHAGPTFGNGREVRNFLETVCARQADRLAEASANSDLNDRDALFRLEMEDIR